MSREYPCVYYDNQKCTLHSEPGYTDWCVLGPCSKETPSNADHIRAMTDEELAELLAPLFACYACPARTLCDKDGGRTCPEIFADWLKQPYEEEG